MSELQQLRDRVAELEEALGLTAQFPQRLMPRGSVKLRMCDALLGMLLARPFVPQRAAYAAIYGDRPYCEQPDPKNIQVAICHLRRFLDPHGIRIKLEWNEGYYIDNANKVKLRALLAAMNAERA